MLKRIAIYFLGFLALFFLVAGYHWLQERRLRAATRKELGAILSEQIAQKDALVALGDADLDPEHLELADLEQKLHEPRLRQPGAKNTTKLGWACGTEHCVIWASFLVPFGQEIPQTLPATGLVLNDPTLSQSRSLGVGGIYLGEPVEQMQKFCQKRGCVSVGKNRMSWSEEWNFIWADTNGKIELLMFVNEKMIQNASAHVDFSPLHFLNESIAQ
jgi:hypothetical protein